ncbi:MAG: adventurous gliding motility lipoprotein CglC [Myxococcaceae bacterium]
MLRHLLLGAFLLSATLFACSTSTDLGAPCTPVKALPDGGVGYVLVGDLSAGKDFVSFGATECSDLVCVVDQASASVQLSEAQRDAGSSLGSPAVGYCSTACVQGNNSTCSPQADNMQDQPGLAMTCRELLLDPALIAEICQNPVKCELYFGSNRSSFFCARGAPADGGS